MWAQLLITIVLILLFWYVGKKMIYDPIMKKGLKEIAEMDKITKDEEYLLAKKEELEQAKEALDLRKEEVSVIAELTVLEAELRDVNDKLLKAEQRRNK